MKQILNDDEWLDEVRTIVHKQVNVDENRTPDQVAQELISEDFPVEEYEALQARRKERLKFWETNGVDDAVQTERKVIAYGEEVLKLLKESKKK